ncbi:hypothetical protein EXIGLDRAFT_746364 [Exidia glandulosa HHB12029]|uniref:Transmembrane protein n=1 Tax=Exidia glandulosa HHB12029 TaxID=1314781 RepID=A0A165MBS0_EXIGL|nr:hypothetical protein EXIGLDRAFT_746364 [Exidia glandulosa HHB12029]
MSSAIPATTPAASTSRLSLHDTEPVSRPASPSLSASNDVASSSEPAQAAAPSHDAQNAPASSAAPIDVPPPVYTRSAAPPPYVEDEESADKELNTLARQLFQYGFFFPLFWFVGACILASNLNPPENWEETKTEDERRELIARLRATEVKWARRCLFASIGFLFLIATVVVVAVVVPRLRH